MAELTVRMGQHVELVGKGVRGRVAYIGLTDFSPGQWVGIVLDENKGRNNGTVKEHSYFECEPNHGIFVRPSQLRAFEASALEGLSSIGDGPASTTTTMTSSSGPFVTNPLMLTKICPPKEAKLMKSAGSQQELHVEPLVPAMTTRSATSAVLPLPTSVKRSKTAISPSSSLRCLKGSSFVETGFIGILQPQFTPGQALRSPSTHLMVANREQMQHPSHKELEAKVLALENEISQLHQQNADNKRKGHELGRLKAQNEKLAEFKAKIVEQQGALQKELQRCRQENRELNESSSGCARELQELRDSIELLTLDKEMAEEKSEMLQIELEIANDRIEELVLDAQILGIEQEGADISVGGNDSAADCKTLSQKLHIAEQHNQRLKQTIITLRDVLSQEKQELLKSTKEVETRNSEISELKKVKELYSNRMNLMEAQITDLKERVDASLGADSMLELLVERKIDLEDRVKLLEEEVTELEALEEIHEQIIEGHQELQADLREEIALLSKTNKTLQREQYLAQETIFDREIVIQKFRHLLACLNDEAAKNDPLSVSNVANSECESVASLDYKHVFSLTKTWEREIDVQLKEVELSLLGTKLDFVIAFLPQEFMARGGDHEVITTLISLHRLVHKVDIICKVIREKFPPPVEFGRESILEGFAVHQYAFRSKLLFFLRSIKMGLEQVICCMQYSDYDVCKKAVAFTGEITRQEQQLDCALRLLRSGELDENSPTDGIETMMPFFNLLHANLTSEQCLSDLVDEHKLFLSLADILETATECIGLNAALLRHIILEQDERTEPMRLLQALGRDMDTIKQHIKGLTLKMPRHSVKFSGVQPSQMKHIRWSNEVIGRLISILHTSAKDALRVLSTSKSDEVPTGAIDHGRLWNILVINCFQLGADVDKDPAHIVQSTTDLLKEQVNEISNFVQDQENAKISNANTVYIRSSSHSLLVRASQVRSQFEEVKSIMSTLETREKEVKTLKYVVKMKQNEFSEMQIRKEMTERNLSKLALEQESAATAISSFLGNMGLYCAKREYHLMTTLTRLESNISRLEEKIGELQAFHNSRDPNNHSDYACMDIDLLRASCRKEYRDRLHLQAEHFKRLLNKLEPISLPRFQKDNTLQHLEEVWYRIKKDWLLSHIDMERNSKTKRAIIKKSDDLALVVLMEYIKRNPQKAVPTCFGTFAVNNMRKS